MAVHLCCPRGYLRVLDPHLAVRAVGVWLPVCVFLACDLHLLIARKVQNRFDAVPRQGRYVSLGQHSHPRQRLHGVLPHFDALAIQCLRRREVLRHERRSWLVGRKRLLGRIAAYVFQDRRFGSGSAFAHEFTKEGEVRNGESLRGQRLRTLRSACCSAFSLAQHDYHAAIQPCPRCGSRMDMFSQGEQPL